MAVLSNKGKRIDELKSLDAGTLANSDLLVVQDVQPTPTTKNITYANLRDKISTDIQASTLSLDNVTSISASKINVNSNGTFGTLRVLGTVSMPNTVSMATANITDATITTQNVGASTITRLNCNSITGSLKGTGSWSRRSITASHALIAATTIVCQTSTTTADTASFLVYTGTPNGTASYAVKSLSSSYAIQSRSSSYSLYALSADSCVTANSANSSTTANNAQTASYILYDIAGNGNLNGTASYATTAKSSSYATQAKSASYATQAKSASYVDTSNAPWAAKAWVNFGCEGPWDPSYFSTSGIVVISSSYNISSVTRTAAGLFTITFSSPSPFTNNKYLMVGTGTWNTSPAEPIILCYNRATYNKTTTSVNIKFGDNDDDPGGEHAVDPKEANVVFFGGN